MIKNIRLNRLLYVALSLIIPAIIIVIALIGMHITPFGDHTLVISDANGLYINYLAYVGRMVQGLEGITYSFEKGIGSNMMDSLGWFLANPSFALFALFDVMDYPTAFTYVSTLNLSLCGLTMYLFLADLRGHGASNLIFSTTYALMGFNVANVFQANFWIGPIMLPLVLMGLARVVKGKGVLIYTVSFACALAMNFYFGFIIGVASVLVFITSIVLGEEAPSSKRRTIVTFVIATIIASLLSAVLWLPALLSLRGGRLDQTKLSDFLFIENMPTLNMAAKLFTGANTTSELVNGLPNIFVGILPVALVVLFFVSAQTSRKRKIAAGALLGVYLVSFYILAFDMIMHGGTVTNWFNYRYSFVFSFLLLYIAAEQWSKLDLATKEEIRRSAAILCIVVLVVFFKRFEFVIGGEVLLDFALLGIMAFMIGMHRKDPQKNPQRILEVVVLLLVSINLTLNYVICTENILDWGIDVPEYRESVMPVSAATEAIQATDGTFFRMESNKQRSEMAGNDPMLFGYNGVGHGGSDQRDSVRNGLSQLGVHRYSMRTFYNEGVPAATDSLLGLKYLVAEEEDLSTEKGYERLFDLLGWNVYKNPNALPIAMVANDGVTGTSLDYEDVFMNLNGAYSTIVGGNAPIFEEEPEVNYTSHSLSDPQQVTAAEAQESLARLEASSSESKASDVASNDKTELPSSLASNSSKIIRGFVEEQPTDLSSIEFSFVARHDGPVYLYNRSALADDEGSIIPVTNYLGNYRAGETVTGFIPVFSQYVSPAVLNDVAAKCKVAYANNAALTDACNAIRSRKSTISKESETHLSGSVELADNNVLLFTIPYDEGWTCLVDGKEAPIEQAFGLFMVVRADAGAHTFELRYTPPGIVVGGIAFGVGLVGLLGIVIGSRWLRLRKDSVATPKEA